MKTSEKQSNPIFLLFWSMPSCSMLKAYKIKSDKLNRAMKEEKVVELVTNNDKVFKLRKIGIEAGKFCGMKGLKGKMKKMLLNINEIKAVTLL